MQSTCPSKLQVANLDFDARVPVPFSVFPSSYKEKTHEVAEQTHEELEIRLPEKAGREAKKRSIIHVKKNVTAVPVRKSVLKSLIKKITAVPLPKSVLKSLITKTTVVPLPKSVLKFLFKETTAVPLPKLVLKSLFKETTAPLPKSVLKSLFKETTAPLPNRPQTYSTPHETVEVDVNYRPQFSAIDNIERTYRARSQTGYEDSASAVGTTVDTTVDPPPVHSHNELVHVSGTRPSYTDQVQFGGSTTSGSTVSGYTVASSNSRTSQHKEPSVVEETSEYPRHTHSVVQKSRMGYYDEDGRYHSFRQGLHKMADKLIPHRDHHHHSSHEAEMHETSTSASPAPVVGPTGIPNTVTIPCHHIRNGDILVLQGRPCQVIRISTSAATGQHRYLGVDLFTKQLHEESSFISHPSPSVVVQTMLGPVLKQYRVLDLSDGTVTCMTETGEVKVGLPVLDQSNLWERISRAFNSGRGSVRVLVLSDQGRELAVDVKVVHGASL
ncbi:hypothetical protein DL771_009588 [Monosporascus sp. 5C6A]|nr:hypothetical protein DL771_009588 [Monosporascus sp. 5C6A]